MSGSSPSNIAITISARDLASAQIGLVNKQIGKLQAPAEQTAKSIAKLASPTSMGKMAAGMQNVSRDSLSAFENIGRIVGPLGIITSAASIAGLAALSREWASFGNQMGNSAQRAGTAVGQLSNFQNAAVLSGASAQSATAGMTSLNDAITNAAAGRSPQAVMAFNQLGVSLKDSTGHLRTAADLLPEVAHGLAGIKNPVIQHDLGNMIFGGSADELMPLFRKFDELTQKAAATGGDWTKKMADDASEMNQAWKRFGLDFTGTTNRIEDEWSGTVTTILTATSDWIEHNKALADSYTKIGAAIMGLGAIKPALWLARLLGLGVFATPAGALVGGAIVGGAATYKNGQDSASAQDEAAKRGYTEVSGTDDQGMPIEYRNPATGDRKSWMQFDRRYNPSLVPTPTPATTPSPAADVQMDPTKRAFLDTIAGPESKGAYDVKNGGSKFTDFSKFPEGVGPGGKSTAAGRYQFISKTWADEQQRLGLPDFSPSSQDKAAWDLAATRYRSMTGEDLEVALRSGNKNTRIAQILGPIWPSLPGGSQSNQSQTQFDRALAANMETDRAAPGQTAGVKAPVPLPPPLGVDGNILTDDDIGDIVAGRYPKSLYDKGQGNILDPSFNPRPSPGIQGGSGTSSTPASETTLKGGADLRIRLDGFPEGTSTKATTDGNVFLGPAKIAYAMPLGMNP